MFADAAEEVDRRLAGAYGHKRRRRAADPLDGLVRTVLSQNTTDINSHRAFVALKGVFPTWDDVRLAPETAISAAIGSGGIANVKAARIKVILERIQADSGKLSLAFLADWGSDKALQYLLRFKGVGPKTAACVLTFYCGQDVFPVDTHVFRIARRLGWLDGRATPESAHQVLQSAIPPEITYQLHLNMVQHGRRLCRPQRPKCGECPLNDMCQHATGNVTGRRQRAGF